MIKNIQDLVDKKDISFLLDVKVIGGKVYFSVTGKSAHNDHPHWNTRSDEETTVENSERRITEVVSEVLMGAKEEIQIIDDLAKGKVAKEAVKKIPEGPGNMTKCATFDQDSIPEDVKQKMAEDRARVEAEKESTATDIPPEQPVRKRKISL